MTFYALDFVHNVDVNSMSMSGVRSRYATYIKNNPNSTVSFESFLEVEYERLFNIAVYHLKRDGQLSVLRERAVRNVDAGEYNGTDQFIVDYIKAW